MTRGFLKSVAAFPFKGRQRKLAANRQPLTEREFIDRITDQGGDRAAAALLWEKLQPWIYAEGFSPDPEDTLEYVFGIAEEELDEDLILDVLTQLNVPVPDQEAVSTFGRIDTPRRIGEFVTFAGNGSNLLLN